MGLDINSVRFLIGARKRGADFGDVLMLGRQDMNVYPARTASVLREAGFPDALFAPGAPDTGYAEPLFKALGARSVSSLDASDFEGAEFVHDLNQPLSDALRQRFDTVYDGGTLEHIFNFPVALKNAMEMLRPGGRLFIHTGTNNWCGHGFYQFSPELFYRAFAPEHGFAVERMVLHRVGPYGGWLEVADPDAVRSRVELVTFMPVQLLVQAQRRSIQPVFARPPQQSDYTPRWTERAPEEAQDERAAIKYDVSRPKLARAFPGLARLMHVARMGCGLYWRTSLWNRRNFRPVKKQ